MNFVRRAVASLEVVLIFPAALFMTALFMRSVQPQQLEPAHTAQRIVGWYAARTGVGLWLFLIGFPIAVLTIGCLSLMRNWRSDAALRQVTLEFAKAIRRHLAVLIIALATSASAVILGIVALHLITS